MAKIGRAREARVISIMEVYMVITFIPVKVEKVVVLNTKAWVSSPCRFSR